LDGRRGEAWTLGHVSSREGPWNHRAGRRSMLGRARRQS